MKTLITSLFIVCIFAGCATSAQRRTQRNLTRATVPRFAFLDANARSVAQYIVDCVQDSEEEPDRTRGRILDLSALPIGKRITIDMKDVSLQEALDTVCQLGDLHYVIEKNGAIYIKEAQQQPEQVSSEAAPSDEP